MGKDIGGVMKLTILCDKCGAEREKSISLVGDMCGVESFKIDVYPCRKCAEPTYGPLTVEMVAEALESADTAIIVKPYERMARFVLRLLEDAHALGLRNRDDTNVIQEWHAWLLDLARQK
jgi:hypothetical protein